MKKQSSNFKKIYIQAAADTGNGDKYPTYFSVTVKMKVDFKYREVVPSSTSTDITSETHDYNIIFNGCQHQINNNVKIYPILNTAKSYTISVGSEIPETFPVDKLKISAKYYNDTLSVVPYPQDT